MSVVFPLKLNVLVLSGNTPSKFCVPSTSRIPAERDSALPFVMKVVFFVFSVDAEIANAFCRTSVVSGSERVEPEARLPPEFSVIVPPEELSFARLLIVKAPESVKLPGPVSRVLPDKVRGVFASVKFSKVEAEPKLKTLPFKLTLPKETALLDESVAAPSNFSTELLLLLNVPALRSRFWLMLKVLPVTSSAPSAPRVSPPSKNRMPPVEVIDPESSCRALESVR